ncbi:SIR2 family NAD-dependent protein deacylase [Desulfatirhabdium butyrativorans]|uniref:SIR2 family NAD-dependent protein deacylase n=1 Tax=Desulfatirhabdium butyrativorans TaxID=340467 RepID=UPI0003FF1008|nr:NAD-dependent deacylase [Desulfatirhabdium butyrativorans]
MLQELKACIEKAQHLTVLTGAGVSAESGIPTFRGGDGLWNRYRPEELATPEAFSRDPETVWRWYAWRMERVFSAQPNPAHLGFAKLQEMGRLACLITQNVDDLHERAGSRDVLHLHGTLRQMRCVACGSRIPVHRPPEVPPLPVCACGGLLRPDVVWFGESLSPDVLQLAFDEASRSDVMIVAGTSAVVHPAASLPLEVKRHGGTVIEINPDATPLSSMADLSIRMPAGMAITENLGLGQS